MQPPKRDENIARLTQLFGSHTVRLSDNTSSDPREQKEKKEMSQLINDFTNMRIRQRVHKAKTNIEIDEDLIKWKNDKLVALDGVWKSVEHIYTLITIIQQKIPKNLAPHVPFDSFQAVHIMKQGRTSRMKGQEEQKKVRAFLEARITTLQSIKEKIGKSRQKFEEYKKKCKSTHTALIGIKKVLDFDYAENGNFFKIHNKPVESQNKKKQEKQIIVFYRASSNFPNPSFYRSLVKANITPADDLEFEYSTLEEEKLKDLYDKTFSISLSHRKKDKKKSLASFQFGNIKKKIFEIEFKILNMQLFNYLLQLTSFGKVVPFEFKHSKSDLDIDCKNHLAIELAYRTKEEFHNLGKDSSNIMIYLMLLWVVNNFQYKNVRVIIQETFGFLGNYQRLKKKLAKWKTLFPGFFYVEELNPKNFEVLIEAYFNYNKESSFNICKRISSNPKKVFVILRGSKLFTINPTIGYLTEVTMEQLIEEEFKNKFWVHLNHQP